MNRDNSIVWGAKVAVMSASLALLAATTPATASAHTPAAEVGCRDGLPYVSATFTKYGQGATVRIRVDGLLTLDHDFTDDYSVTQKLGSGYQSHDVTVRVLAQDDPDGSLGYSKTFRLEAPPCKEQRLVEHPAAHLYGPFLDPQYFARFDNRASTVPCTFHWYRRDAGTMRVVTRIVAAGHSQSTKLRHADGGTMQTITGCGETLLVRKTAPGGNYPAP